MKRILIVEDYYALADLESLLCTMEGYQVQIARTGHDGIAAFDKETPDLVLLDIILPGEVDGLGVLKYIREKGDDPKVLVVSAQLDPATRETVLAYPAVDIMHKPFKPNDLAARILALVG